MDNFGHVRVGSPEEAVAALGRDGDIRILAGGTDLIPLMKDEIATPGVVVDISGWDDGSYIRTPGEGMRIGALTPLSQIAANDDIRRSYTALAEACQMAATPQLRNMGTIGGNLLQQTRCWYYRGPHRCWMKGGDECFARNGENEYHSIFETEPSPCVSAHPSDPAAALLALDARVRWRGPDGEHEVSSEEFFRLPEESRRSYVVLPHDSVLTEIVLPRFSAANKSIYAKAMPRAAWAFALAGVAISFEETDGRASSVRIALSGVAPIPLRARHVEEALTGRALADLDREALAALLVEGARPLEQNGYKVRLLKGLFRQALTRVLGA